MESQEFIVLYTHQKTKKSKVWQDGILKLTHLGNKAILYDDKGECLESLFLKRLEVKPGDDLESDRYLITVEEARVAGSQEGVQEAPGLCLWQSMPSGRSLGCQPAGLKRKFTGFRGPCRVTKKTLPVENGESATLEAATLGPAFLSPFSSNPPLFPAVGKRGVNVKPTDLEDHVAHQDSGRGGPPASPVGAAPSSRSSPERPWDLCSPVTSTISLLSDEPRKAPHCSGVTHSIRSRAQVLALLRAQPGASEDVASERSGHVPRAQTQGSVQIPTKPKCFLEQQECADGRTGTLRCQRPSESARRSKSRWAVYLASQSSPAPSTTDGNDLEREPEAQGDDINLNLKDLWVQKRTQVFETGAENEEKCHEEELADSTDSFWPQEVRLESPSFSESSSLSLACGNMESDSFVSESDIQVNTEKPVNHNDQMCIKGSTLSREDAQEINPCGSPEREPNQAVSYLLGSECLQRDSSPRNSSEASDAFPDTFSRRNADSEGLSICGPASNVMQPVLEVNFNLNNFETSDTEEESQESYRMSQDPQGWDREAWADDCGSGVQKRDEGARPEEGGGAPLSLSMPIGGAPTRTLPAPEALLAQLCGKAGPSGDEVVRCSDSAVEGTDDVGAGDEAVTTPTPKVRSNNDFASLPNESQGINSNVYVPHFLNNDTNQAPETNLFSDQTHLQAFFMASDLDTDEEPVLSLISGSDDSIRRLNASQNHLDGCVAPDKSNPQVFNPLLCSLGRKHPICKDTAHIPESEDLGGISSFPRDHVEVGTAGASRQCWNNPRNSSELPGLVRSISLLRSLSEHSTALEGLEMLKKENASIQQQGTVQTREPEDSPEAGKPWITVVSQAVPQSPHLNQGSQLYSAPVIMRENEVGPSEPLQPLQLFPLGSEEEMVFPAVTPTQTERKAWDPQVSWLPQEGAASSPGSAFSPDSRDEDFLLEFSEEALEARTLPGTQNFSSLENQKLQRLPFLGRARVPLVTVPPAAGPPGLGPRSCALAWGWRPCSASPLGHPCELPLVLPLSSGPEDQSKTSSSPWTREVRPGDVPCLDLVSAPSKWLKYQSPPQCDLGAPNRPEAGSTDGFSTEAVPGMCFGDTGGRRSHSARAASPGLPPLQVVRGALSQQQQLGTSAQGFVCKKEALSLGLTSPNVWGEPAISRGGAAGLQEINVSELCFPSGRSMKSALPPQRQMLIPVAFQSPAHYKQVFTSCLVEHLNVLLSALGQRLHRVVSTVDISSYTSSGGEKRRAVESPVPFCRHQQPAKLVMVKKEGPNKDRLFYTCDAPKADRCNFFKWLEEVTPGHVTQEASRPAMVLHDIKSVGLYLRSQKIPLYEECLLLVRKGFDFQRKQHGKLKKFPAINPEFYTEPKSKLYLRLSRKESSSAYSKDDLWVVSKTLDFELDTFIACSAFFGPSSLREVELLPLKGYFPSQWPTDTVVHALWVCNASTELTTLRNLQDHFNPATLPLTPHLLAMSSSTAASNRRVDKRQFIPPAFSKTSTNCDPPSPGAALQLASEFVQAHQLNEDQASALTQIARMVASHGPAEEVGGPSTCPLPITIVHGVFGAGKSYLLAVVVLFLVQLFEKSEAPAARSAGPWKVLVSSSTNVAVDRVLLGLLSLGFEKFVRVGSVRKIAKPVLPYSLYAGSENASEQLKELHALMKEDLTPVERVYVRRSIEQHKLGTNRMLLGQVRVVGATCAACPFPCMNGLRFPIVVLDECSQMTEPASLLPVARFECEKLVLVGDPKQLPPTIQGSDSAHEHGLEQTLFDRLCLMGHQPILLRTQYRCHPAISAVANDLFYGGSLRDGVSAAERSPLLAWLPTLCFYNVPGREQIEGGNSFHNEAEAAFTLTLTRSLVAAGIAGSVIGVITLYRSQLGKLCQLLGAAGAGPSLAAVQVATVDAFQGAEKEVVILSCVRTRQVGFIDSEKRMNVALTRGRRHLLIVGNLACLRRNRLWGRVIRHCEGREDGLQHASQCEPQLSQLLRDYCEKQAEEKPKKKSGKDKCKDASCSQKGLV